jgi:mannose-6-phosphate isomerase-like protein (cupin superfamily)
VTTTDPTWTHLSLDDRTPDTAADWGTIRWCASDELTGTAATVGYVEIAAGERNPLHMHPNCTEVLVLLEGTLAHEVGDDVVELAPRDVLVIPPATPHRATNTGTVTARMLVAYDAGTREFVRVEER